MKGSEIIKKHLSDAPETSGIYNMLDKERRIIYIGKAKNLKKRLASYTKPDVTGKTARMVELVAFIEYTITESETEALLLEAQLIKQFKPKFNILLKDDKSFPYIKLRLDHDYPQLIKYRGKTLSDGKFFGPFASSAQVDITLNELQKLFKLRPCSDNYFAGRTRPCLQYQIGRCYGPCVQKISKENYQDLVDQVYKFLTGKTQDLQNELSDKMQQLSSELRFEEAAEIRNRIKALSYIQLKSGIVGYVRDADVIAIAFKNGLYCIEVFLYRSGQPCGNKPYFPLHTEDERIEDVLQFFINQFYQGKVPPQDIIISHKIEQADEVAAMLYKLYNVKVNIIQQPRGIKLKLVTNALSNAEIALDAKIKSSYKNQEMLEQVKELFELETTPSRIEVYDNSHIMGSFAVGAMIVATADGFDKKEYRTFNIKSADQIGDDYAMLKEVLTRRLERTKKEPQRIPSLIIIDGGKGHMSTVANVMNELKINIPFVCMSKGVDRNAGNEQFHVPGKAPFTLDKTTPLMKYLQILRDEVHNFAIKTHRNKRSKNIRASSLDALPGIGKSRKQALLNYFGSYNSIKEASVEDLAKVQGISKALAKTIFTSIHH